MSNRPWLIDLIENKLLPILAQLADCDSDIPKAQQLNYWLRLRWVERGFRLPQQQRPLMEQTRAAIKHNLGETHFSLRYIDFTPDEQALLSGGTNHTKTVDSSVPQSQSAPKFGERIKNRTQKHSSSFAEGSEDTDDFTSPVDSPTESQQSDNPIPSYYSIGQVQADELMIGSIYEIEFLDGCKFIATFVGIKSGRYIFVDENDCQFSITSNTVQYHNFYFYS
jgi:hypothetical protein